MTNEQIEKGKALLALISNAEKLISTLRTLKSTLGTREVFIRCNEYSAVLSYEIANMAITLQLENELEKLSLLQKEFEEL